MALSVAAGVSIILLLKYGVDILLIAMVILAVGVPLHVLSLRLAESEVASPALLLLIVLSVGAVGYAFVVPNDPLDSLGDKLPAWLVRTLEWSQHHGWGQTALIGPLASHASEAESTGPDGAPAPPLTPSGLPPTYALPRLTVTASATVLRLGQDVTLIARPAEATGVPDGSARFYDGETTLATVGFVARDGTAMASLIVANLAPGAHDIRAAFVGPLGRTGPRSEPAVLTVQER